METKVKTYVESFSSAMDLFLKDCEVRNLRPHTIRYYQNEIYASLNQLREQGINAESLSPVEITPNSTLIRDVFGTISLILNWLKTD